MLNFKVQQQNLYDKVSERGIPLYGTLPANGIIFSDGTSDLSLRQYNIQFQSIIPSSNAYRICVYGNSPANLGTAVNFSYTATTGSATSTGDHVTDTYGTNEPAGYLNWYSTSPTFGIATYKTLGGAHTHTYDVAWNGSVNNLAYLGPQKFNLGMWQPSSSANRFSIPSGGIVLRATAPTSDYTQIPSSSAYMGFARSGVAFANQGTTDGGNDYNITSSTSTTHLHSSGNVIKGATGGSGVYISGSGGAHTHTITLSHTWSSTNVAYLNSWRASQDTFITSGTIIGWNNTSTSLPTGWFFCDGGTYNGTVTPNLNSGKKIALNVSGQTHGTVVGGTDTVTVGFVSATTPAQHNHGWTLSGGFALNNVINYDSHGGFTSTTWPHSHSWTSSTVLNGSPTGFNLPFIIYLP